MIEAEENLRPLRVGLVQLCVGREVAANVAAAASHIRAAAADGATYIQTPENTNLIELNRKRLLESLGPRDDTRTLDAFRDLAAELGIWLHLGSLVVRLADDRTTNRAHMIAPDGSLAATYDKVNMFDAVLANGERYRESAAYEAGDQVPVVELPFARVAMMICYDLRFPALYRSAAQAGAEILTAPSAFTEQTGIAHWHVLQQARAIENGAFMISAAQGGVHESGRRTFGHSLVVDPWGAIRGEHDGPPGATVLDIDLAEVARTRRRIASLTHDRSFTFSFHHGQQDEQRGAA
ncbi:MAG: carbon-nitrogen hydrolase family protein [Pseudomonadota bacterium]